MQVCPSCGERNPERAKFCLRCGVALDAPVRRDQERKVVTVLFCDLVGFTARSDRADPEDVKATLRPYHSAIKRVIEGFGGTLDKFVGDGAIGVFGAPVAHEDDPERAVRVAFRIQEEIARLNEGSTAAPLAVRIGIDTGEAVVALGPGPQVGERVTGDVLAGAGRLQSIAPVGAIAVGEATYRATRDRFDFEPLEPEGAPDTGTAWRPIEVSRLVIERPNTPFVGRTEESSLLRAAYRRCAAEPSVQLVTITGEPGVGKSRLIQEFADHLDSQPELIRWRQGRCLPYGEAVGFWPLSEMVKAEAGILESDQPDDARSKLARKIEAAVDDPSERDWLLARLEPLAGLGPVGTGGDRSESFTAWRRFFEALASQHALLLVFEDLHWADTALLEFIEHLVGWSTGLPMLILCAARPELYDRWPGWGGGMRNAATISLPPLSEAETASLLSGLLDQAVLPADTQAALLERAGGNPLYAEEFVRMLIDRGILERSGRTMRLTTDAIPVPETLHAIIRARLDTLPLETKVLLQGAAVLGRVFWTGAIARMTELDLAEVHGRLHEVARLELIRPIRSSSVKDEEEYAFWHILVRDVAYAQIPRSERGSKHRAAAEWIAEVAGERVADQAEVLAYHFGEALEAAMASGTKADVEELRELTVRALILAGKRARRLDARSAIKHFSRVLDLVPPGHARRGDALVKAADVEATLGRFPESRAHFDEAIEAHRATGDVLGLGEAMALKSRAIHRLGDLRNAQRLLDEAVEMLEKRPPTPELARAYSRRAGNLLALGRFEDVRALAERTLQLAEELGLKGEAVRARQFLGAARCEMGDAAGLADLWGALRESLELGLGVETAITYGNLANQLWLLDGPAISLQVWDSAVEFAEVRGFVTERMWSRCGQLEAMFDLGRWDELVEISREIETWDMEDGGGQMRTFAAFYRAMVLVRRGQIQEAVLLEEEFLPRVRILGRAEFLAPALTIGGLLEWTRGHGATAVDLVQEFARETQAHPGYRLQFLPDALRVLLACGRGDLAASIVPESAEIRNVRHRHALATAQACLAEANEEHEEAVERYAACAKDWLSYGSVLERAHALFGEARCRLVLGDTGAAPLFDQAREAFVSLGAVLAADAIDGMLGEAEAVPS